MSARRLSIGIRSSAERSNGIGLGALLIALVFMALGSPALSGETEFCAVGAARELKVTPVVFTASADEQKSASNGFPFKFRVAHI